MMGKDTNILSDVVKTKEEKFPDWLQKKETIQSIHNLHLTEIFPIEAFPEFYQNLINVYKDVSAFQRSYSGITIISAFATCIGNSFKVRIKNNWSEPALTYSALYGDSSQKKTPVLNTFLMPFYEKETQYQKQYEIELNDWELSEKKGKKPKRKHIIINDATPESITDMHANNLKGLLYHNDELISQFKRFNQYRNGPDQEFWLSQWSNSPVKITRKSQDTVYFKNPCITTIGGMQPIVTNDLAKDNRGENGFLYRILFAIPEDNEIEQWSEKEIDKDLIVMYDKIIRNLDLFFDSFTNNPLEIEFSESAKKIFIEWYNQNAELIHNTDDLSLKSIYKKLEAYFFRLALILEVMYQTEDSTEMDNLNINDDATNGAIKLIEYFRYTSKFINDKIKSEGFKDETDKKIYNELPDQFTTSQLISIAQSHGMTKSTVENRLISRWKKDESIKKIGHGKYTKGSVEYEECVDFESKDDQLSISVFGKPFNELREDQKTVIIERNS